MKNRKSFTLMELLVVITIIAVLAAVSIPQVIGVIQRAQDVAIRTSMRVMLTEATRISILEGDLSRIHCNTGGHPDILAICDTVRAHSPHPAQLRSSATTRTFWIRAPLHDGTFWRVDHTGFAGRDLGDYIARWDMDEGSDQVVGDVTGTNPGTRGPTTTPEPQDPTWAVDHLTFDGVNDWVDIPFNFGRPTHLTISLWFRTTAAAQKALFGQANTKPPTTPPSHVPTITIRADGRIRAEFWTVGTGAITTTTVHNDGAWHYVAFVGSGTSQELFVNGVSVGTRAGTIDHSWWTLSTIGTGFGDTGRGFPSNAWYYFNGHIDNVRIYNRALTSEEVRVSFLRGR